LTAQGFAHLAAAYQGFDPANILHTEVVLPKAAYGDQTRIVSFFRQFLRDVRALPSVSSAALVANPPASNVDSPTTFFTIEGRPAVRPSEAPSAELQVASPDYFETLRIPLISGRTLSEADTSSAPAAAVISQSMAQRFWPSGDALGHRIQLGSPTP